LGMVRKPKTEEEEAEDAVKKADETRRQRKEIQEDHMAYFEKAKGELKEEIKEVEGGDIEDRELKKRRDWIQQYRSDFPGKFPDGVEKFYEKDNVKEDKKEGEDEDEAEAKGKKKKKGEKKGKKGKGKKGKGDDDGDKEKLMKIGPSEVVQKFDQFYDEYNVDWSNRDERDNREQAYDRVMAREEVMPLVEKEYRADVDAMIKMELENLKALSGVKGKKKKKKGKKKKGKKSKKKKLKLHGAKYIRDMSEYDMLVELVKNGIVKKLPPTALTDFIGEFNYIHLMIDNILDTPREPSMALIRQLVTEYIIFPLGSALCRARFPEMIRSVLFYGPSGTGKTQVVRAIATETRAVLYDLSPLSIEGVFNSPKTEGDKLVAMVMIAAKEFQPSLIYLDECEKIFPAAKKKGKKKGGKKRGTDNQAPSRIKKALMKTRAQWITPETRITIVGCTSEPHEGSKKDFKKFFDKSIYFPFPDYTTRRLMWKTFIANAGGKLKADFPVSTLAHISDGYSAGSIKKTC